MTINKAHWVTEGDNVRFSMPIGKIDQEKRIVSGFATLDNLDKQNDIVDTAASLDAFRKFKGNIREMHQPLAVGKIVSFKEDRYFDPTSKKFYSGVYVSAYVSKGAQDTWEKVLDGTLSGFSIGGNITKFDDEFSEELNKSIRIIKEYELFELSLVDSPANQFANVVSIEKVNGTVELSGYLSKTTVDNVYWCKEDDIVQLSEGSDTSCPTCNKAMSNIGFVEKNDSENIETVKFLVDSAKGIRTIKMTKEVSPMTENTEVVTDAVEATDAPEVDNVEVAPEAPVDAPAEIAEEVTEVLEEEPVAKTVDGSAPSIEEETNKIEDVIEATAEVAKAVSNINESFTNALSELNATIKSVQDNVASLAKSLEAVSGEVNQVKGVFNEFGKRVDAVEHDTAFRKSGDLGEIVQEFPEMRIQKSLWGGRFLTNADLFN